MSLKGEMNAEFNEIDNKVFWRHKNMFLLEDGWLYTLLMNAYPSARCIDLCNLRTNVYPGVKRPYSQMQIMSNMG